MPRGKQQLSSTQLNPGEPIAGFVPQSVDGPVSPAGTSPSKVSPPAGSTEVKRHASGSRSEKLNTAMLQGARIGTREGTLQDEVREALRSVLHDKRASAAARASAGRTLLEYFVGGLAASGRATEAAELTAGELDELIARESARLTKGL